jgi:hypothetical protein
VSENDALRVTIEKLQTIVLHLRQQLLQAGLTPVAEVATELVGPSPHVALLNDMIKSARASTAEEDGASTRDVRVSEFGACSQQLSHMAETLPANQMLLLHDLQDLQKMNARLQLHNEQILWDTATYKAQLDKVGASSSTLLARSVALAWGARHSQRPSVYSMPGPDQT